jgi:hypothetical protein
MDHRNIFIVPKRILMSTALYKILSVFFCRLCPVSINPTETAYRSSSQRYHGCRRAWVVDSGHPRHSFIPKIPKRYILHVCKIQLFTASITKTKMKSCAIAIAALLRQHSIKGR